MKSFALAAVALSFLTAGCATYRYGRQLPLTDAERATLTCEQLDVEIAKSHAFMEEVHKGAPDGKAALGILGDLGIGNSMEQQDALKSGKIRLDDLKAQKATKGCP